MSKILRSGKFLAAPGDKSPAAGKIAGIHFKDLIVNNDHGLTRILHELRMIDNVLILQVPI